MVLTGDVIVPNVSLKGTGKAPFDDRQMALLTRVLRDSTSTLMSFRQTKYYGRLFEPYDAGPSLVDVHASGNLGYFLGEPGRDAPAVHATYLQGDEFPPVQGEKLPGSTCLIRTGTRANHDGSTPSWVDELRNGRGPCWHLFPGRPAAHCV